MIRPVPTAIVLFFLKRFHKSQTKRLIFPPPTFKSKNNIPETNSIFTAQNTMLFIFSELYHSGIPSLKTKQRQKTQQMRINVIITYYAIGTGSLHCHCI